MTKEEVAQCLIRRGHDAGVIDGVVIVRVEKPLKRTEKNSLREHLREMGYRGSWGWRSVRITTDEIQQDFKDIQEDDNE